MGTLRQGISRVRSLNKMLSVDTLISDRVIADELKSTATLLVKRETNLRKLWQSPNLFTFVKCLKMIPVPLAECCDYKSPCVIRRSECKIPKIEEGIHELLMLPVTSIDGKIKFESGSATRYSNILKVGLKKKILMSWIQNNYLYVTDENVEAVNFAAYFPDGDTITIDPNCVCNPNLAKDSLCVNPLDQDWKIPSYLEENAVAMVHDKISKTYFRHSFEDQSDITKNDQR